MSAWTNLSEELAGIHKASKKLAGDFPQLAAYVFDRCSAYSGPDHPRIATRLIQEACRAAAHDAASTVMRELEHRSGSPGRPLPERADAGDGCPVGGPLPRKPPPEVSLWASEAPPLELFDPACWSWLPIRHGFLELRMKGRREVVATVRPGGKGWRVWTWPELTGVEHITGRSGSQDHDMAEARVAAAAHWRRFSERGGRRKRA